MAKKDIGTCELCGRQEIQTTIHHLVPKEMGGTFLPTAKLCIACHKQIHALYTNQELATRLSTISELRQDSKIKSYLKWISKQPASKLVKTRKSNERKRRGR